MFEFAYPWALLLIPVWAAAAYYVLFRKREPSLTVASAGPFRSAHRRRIDLPKVLILLGALLLIAALARPRFGDEETLIRAQGIDIVLALDLSGSMGALDVPESVTDRADLERRLAEGSIPDRLETAKAELTRFVEERPNDRIGLIVFGPMAYNLVPPTLDHSWLIGQLARLRPGMIGDATNIAAPLASGIRRLRESAAPRRVLVLFTDGRNNVEDRLTPEQTAELGRESGVTVHTVGIGSRRALYGGRDAFGRTIYQQVPNDFDEDSLKAIAASSGGHYFHAADADGMARVMAEINQLETTSFEQPKRIEYRERGPRLAACALALILLGWGLGRTWKLRLP